MQNYEHHSDEFFMQRALELAALGLGKVSPNPLVGCVIVHRGRIIGEGWHQQYGEPHAEVNAIASVQDKSLLPESTAFVTLEPCSHFGKTPPCADLLIREKLKHVVIANVDSNPLVSGKGIQKLRDAGVKITTGILEESGRILNKRFFTFMEKKRPFIILKWAQTSDGFIARKNFDSKWISSDLSRQLVHKWRTEEDAILVGTSTAHHDNPKLNVRSWTGRNPTRIVIDKNLRLASNLHLFDRSQKTLCYNLIKDHEENNLVYIKLQKDTFNQDVIDDLYIRKIQSVIIEGGAQTINSFIDLNLWDEARVFVAEKLFGDGIPAPRLTQEPKHKYSVQGDTLTVYNR